jgi:lipopolysaccharide/colanic/teichoic acid biosynthesis glycosyltransferase
VAVEIQEVSAAKPGVTDLEPPARAAKLTQEVKRPVAIFPAVSVRRRWYLPVKAAAEFLFALALMTVALPLIGVLALLVKLSSRGPAFYRQTRVGQYGQHFSIIKLRTMVDNCESLTGPRWCVPGDPRVTRLGQILRATHLDELPQLFNVLGGAMSIIGPRPERPEFLPNLERSLPGYRNRLLVRPGVTGLAQVQLPPDTDLESVRRKLRFDLYYVEHASPLLDLRILLCTGLYALGVPFRIGGTLFGVPGNAAVIGTEAPAAPEPVRPQPRIAA